MNGTDEEFRVTGGEPTTSTRLLENQSLFVVPWAPKGWTYLDGVYFAVVSLTTIGFGDLVPGQHGWFYRLALINWIIIGTSYFAVFISFVSKAMSVRLGSPIGKMVFAVSSADSIGNGTRERTWKLHFALKQKWLATLKLMRGHLFFHVRISWIGFIQIEVVSISASLTVEIILM